MNKPTAIPDRTLHDLSQRPLEKNRRRYDIRELVARIPKDYLPQELNWGDPVGREAW